MDKAYRLGDELFDSILKNISKLDKTTYYLDADFGYCQSVIMFSKFNSTATTEAKKCIEETVMGATTEAVTNEVTEQVTQVVTQEVSDV